MTVEMGVRRGRQLWKLCVKYRTRLVVVGVVTVLFLVLVTGRSGVADLMGQNGEDISLIGESEMEDDEDDEVRMGVKELMQEQEKMQAEMEQVSIGNETFVRDAALEYTWCYVRMDGEERFCVPSLIVGGLPRSGWGVLYYKLSLHANIVAAERIQDCPTEDTEEAALDWFRRQVKLGAHRKYSRLMSGCDIYGMKKVMAALLRLSPHARFIFVVRNFADWAHSRFVHECWEGYDEKCGQSMIEREEGEWEEVVNERHEAFSFLQMPLAVYRPVLEELLQLGDERVLVVRQEDVKDLVGRVLSAAAGLVGVGEEDFAEEAFDLVKVGDWFGAGEIEQVEGGARDELDEMWRGECLWLKQEVGIFYDDVC